MARRRNHWNLTWYWSMVVTLLLLLWIQNSEGRKFRGPKWWNLGKTVDPSNLISNEILSNSLSDHHLSEHVQRLLRKKQRRLVRENEGILVALAEGTKMAVRSCKFQFRMRRWNCSAALMDAHRRKKGLFGKIVSIPCRETAFLYALTSAAVLHSVTRACTDGSINTCSCEFRSNRLSGPRHNLPLLPSHQNSQLRQGDDWEWGGCSENIEFGYKFSRSFVDAGEKAMDLRAAMNLHNNEAGRRHVRASMRTECKCHGMSGSCTVKTCWSRLPHFREVGDRLKERFDGASRVLSTNTAHIHHKSNNIRRSTKQKKKRKKLYLQPYNPNHKSPSVLDLVYLGESPNFCVKNRTYGITGTVGRECNSTSVGVDGCDLMCCGRGFQSRMMEVTERCFCTFHWCCEVKCKSCRRKKIINTCY